MIKSLIATYMPFYVQLAGAKKRGGDCHPIVGIRTEEENKLEAT
jgi:hypothetical protein